MYFQYLIHIYIYECSYIYIYACLRYELLPYTCCSYRSCQFSYMPSIIIQLCVCVCVCVLPTNTEVPVTQIRASWSLFRTHCSSRPQQCAGHMYTYQQHTLAGCLQNCPQRLLTNNSSPRNAFIPVFIQIKCLFYTSLRTTCQTSY